MLRYPVVLEPDDNDTILVSFPDFPEAHTFGDDKVEALTRAVDALETIIDAYIRDRRAIPAPSRRTGDVVALPALVDVKVQIYNAMRAQHVGKAELAKRLHVHLPQIDRLLDVRHGSKVAQLEAAADALGGRLTITLDLGLVQIPVDAYARGVKAAAKKGVRVATKARASTRRPPARTRKSHDRVTSR